MWKTIFSTVSQTSSRPYSDNTHGRPSKQKMSLKSVLAALFLAVVLIPDFGDAIGKIGRGGDNDTQQKTISTRTLVDDVAACTGSVKITAFGRSGQVERTFAQSVPRLRMGGRRSSK